MREGQYREQGLKLKKKVNMYPIRYAKGSPLPVPGKSKIKTSTSVHIRKITFHSHMKARCVCFSKVTWIIARFVRNIWKDRVGRLTRLHWKPIENEAKIWITNNQIGVFPSFHEGSAYLTRDLIILTWLVLVWCTNSVTNGRPKVLSPWDRLQRVHPLQCSVYVPQSF